MCWEFGPLFFGRQVDITLQVAAAAAAAADASSQTSSSSSSSTVQTKRRPLLFLGPPRIGVVGACERDRKRISRPSLHFLQTCPVSLLALDEAESVGEMSGESSHCRRLIRVCPSGMSRLSFSTAASASGSNGLLHETRTRRIKVGYPTQTDHTARRTSVYISNIVGILNVVKNLSKAPSSSRFQSPFCYEL